MFYEIEFLLFFTHFQIEELKFLVRLFQSLFLHFDFYLVTVLSKFTIFFQSLGFFSQFDKLLLCHLVEVTIFISFLVF